MIALFPDDPSWLVTLALALALVAAGVALWAALEMYTWVLQLLGCDGIRLQFKRPEDVRQATAGKASVSADGTPWCTAGSVGSERTGFGSLVCRHRGWMGRRRG